MVKFQVRAEQQPVKPGTYPAVLIGLREREKDSRSFVIWEFEVRAKAGSAIVSGITSLNFGRQSKARAWVEALLGRTLQPGEAFTEADLVGLPCYVVVGERFLPDGSAISTVTQVLPRSED